MAIQWYGIHPAEVDTLPYDMVKWIPNIQQIQKLAMKHAK